MVAPVRILLLILFAIAYSSPSFATPFVPDFSAGPVVFDFEDGLQGWTVRGAATRANTQVLGGEWAIFGDGLATGGAFMSLEIDLTEVSHIVVEQFFAGESGPPHVFAGVGIFIQGAIFIGTQKVASSNPGVWTAGFSKAVVEIGIVWGCAVCDPLDPTYSTSALGFVDNITLIPVPEPSTSILGISALGWLIRKPSNHRSRLFRKSRAADPGPTR